MLYKVHYQYETCFDDGGVGHESWWADSYQWLADPAPLNDKEAKEMAQKLIDDHNKDARPCGGTFCDNKGRYRLRYVECVIPEVLRRL